LLCRTTEGGMCSSVGEFVKRYFKGNSSLEVWVIRFQFIELEQPAPAQTSPSIGVYSNSGTKPNSNSALALLAMSIHQPQLSDFGVYSDSGSKTNRYSLIPPSTKSIHQASLTHLGVYSEFGSKIDKYSLIPPSTKSIHQPSLTHLGVYANSESKTGRYFLITSVNKSIHQARTYALTNQPKYG